MGVICSEPAAIDLVVTFGVRRVRVGRLGFRAALAHGASFVVDTAHWVWSESAVRWRGVGIPLEFFFPIPSLSTTSSLHLMRRTEEFSFALGVSSPLSRRVPVSRTVDESRDSVVVWSWGVVPGWRVRDMTTDNNSHWLEKYHRRNIGFGRTATTSAKAATKKNQAHDAIDEAASLTALLAKSTKGTNYSFTRKTRAQCTLLNEFWKLS